MDKAEIAVGTKFEITRYAIHAVALVTGTQGSVGIKPGSIITVDKLVNFGFSTYARFNFNGSIGYIPVSEMK